MHAALVASAIMGPLQRMTRLDKSSVEWRISFRHDHDNPAYAQQSRDASQPADTSGIVALVYAKCCSSEDCQLKTMHSAGHHCRCSIMSPAPLCL